MKKIKTISLIVAISGTLLWIPHVFAEDTVEGITEDTINAAIPENPQTKDQMQRALALSKRPINVGQDQLDRESDGLYGLPQQALDNLAMGRMFPKRLP